MSIEKLLEDFNTFIIKESLQMTPELVKKIMDASFEDYEIEEDEKINVYTYDTGYNRYNYYSPMYSNKQIMLADDFRNIVLELCEAFTQALPDKFDRFVNVEDLKNAAKSDLVILEQIIDFLNRLGEDFYRFKDVEYVTVDNIEYITYKEV